MAIVTAMSASVTVSMGEETMGVRRTMFLEMRVDRSTCAEMNTWSGQLWLLNLSV